MVILLLVESGSDEKAKCSEYCFWYIPLDMCSTWDWIVSPSCFSWTGPLKASNSMHYHTTLHLWNMMKVSFPCNHVTCECKGRNKNLRPREELILEADSSSAFPTPAKAEGRLPEGSLPSWKGDWKAVQRDGPASECVLHLTKCLCRCINLGHGLAFTDFLADCGPTVTLGCN